MIGSWTLVTPPTDEPVTLTEIRDHLRISGTAEDSLLMLYAQMAREAVEAETWRALMPQTWDLLLQGWPSNGVIELPRPPLQSVTSIKYTDEDGVVKTLAPSNYAVDIAKEPGRVVLATNGEWPSDALYSVNAVAVRFVAGYADASAVPTMAKAAILLQTAEIYANREAVGPGAQLTVAPVVQRVLNLLRVRW
jgi:uncharacterized phiE125 gp8 family phage protein